MLVRHLKYVPFHRPIENIELRLLVWLWKVKGGWRLGFSSFVDLTNCLGVKFKLPHFLFWKFLILFCFCWKNICPIEIINNKARHNLIDAKCRWRSNRLDGAGSFREPLGQTKVMQIRQGETLNHQGASLLFSSSIQVLSYFEVIQRRAIIKEIWYVGK